LSLVDRLGFSVAMPGALPGFRSSEIQRGADGGFIIAVSSSPHSGNCCRSESKGRFALVLRLYDCLSAQRRRRSTRMRCRVS